MTDTDNDAHLLEKLEYLKERTAHLKYERIASATTALTRWEIERLVEALRAFLSITPEKT
jgi:hypothetical protein